MARKWSLGALQPHKYTEGVFPIDEQPNSHKSCNHIEDSFSQAMVRPAVGYITAGSSGRPGKTCNTGNLNGAKTLPAASPQSLYITTKWLNHW